jgi:hypothetical protein
MKQRVQILKKSAFPANDYFDHLFNGSLYYQHKNFERAVEEWTAAGWLKYEVPIRLKRTEGRIFCGGYLREIPFIFFLYAVYSNRASGVGAVKTDGVAKNLVFNKGRLVRAGTTRREERIGNFILKRGNLTTKKMEPLINDAKKQGKRIGRYMVERGLISEETLQEILSLQVEEIISDIFFWQKGHFYFLEKPIIREAVVNFDPLNIARIAAQRSLSVSDFRNKIPSNKIIFRASPYLEGRKEEIMKALNVNHQFVFSLIDGVRNIDQLIKFSGADEVSVINILYQLNTAGLIRQTKEVAEYEDKEFGEISKILEVFCEVFKIIYEQLFRELGKASIEIIRRSRENLKNHHKDLFLDVALETPDSLNINSILRNIAQHYPGSDQRALFMDAFSALFDNLLKELKRFLGLKLAAETFASIRAGTSNIVRFAKESELKMRLLGILNRIAQ